MSFCIRYMNLRPNLVGSLCRYSTIQTKIVETNDHVLIDDSDVDQAKEAEIERKRNISRLATAHQNIIHGRRPYEEAKSVTHLTVKYNRKMYGKYGSASGVNPVLCFPTKKEISEKLEYETIAYPFSIKQMMDQVAAKKKEDEIKVQQRDREVANKFVKLELWKKELNDKIAKKVSDASAAKVKKERLVEEVRRHFGFKLDTRDERFQEMLAKREKEQKKQEKMAKREAKEKQMIAQLQQKNVELSNK